MSMNGRDAEYVELLLGPLRECRKYRPAFGQSSKHGLSLAEFKAAYSSDRLYHWVGLDSDLVYAAHRAAGGMTSIYRQLGIGCERLLCAAVRDSLGLSVEQSCWSYGFERDDGTAAAHTLDSRINITDVKDRAQADRVRAWLRIAAASLGIRASTARSLRGAILEIRQGYESADSKRQNADLRFGIRAYTANYLPVIAVVSSQVSEPVCRRYRASQMLVLTGADGNAASSTFAFFRDVVGFDLAGFLERHAELLRHEIEEIIRTLLSAS